VLNKIKMIKQPDSKSSIEARDKIKE
jgi:hypothetical protein